LVAIDTRKLEAVAAGAGTCIRERHAHAVLP
jgi:hypothetical protein